MHSKPASFSCEFQSRFPLYSPKFNLLFAHVASRASCKVTNLSIRSTLAPCIVHCGGVLHVEGCSLSVDPGGLAFLCSPLVTCASDLPLQQSLSEPGVPAVLSAGSTITGSRPGSDQTPSPAFKGHLFTQVSNLCILLFGHPLPSQASRLICN